MFGIAAYLIAVEYIDYEMQNKVKRITKKEVELDQLTPLPSAMPQLLPLLRGRGQEPDLPPTAPGGAGELCPVRRPGGGGSGPAAPGSRGAEAAPPHRSRSPAPAKLRSRRTAGALRPPVDDQAWDGITVPPRRRRLRRSPESVTESAAEPPPFPSLFLSRRIPPLSRRHPRRPRSLFPLT